MTASILPSPMMNRSYFHDKMFAHIYSVRDHTIPTRKIMPVGELKKEEEEEDIHTSWASGSY